MPETESVDDEPELHPKRLANPKAKCPRHRIDGYRELIEAAWVAGWWCERGGNQHIKCYPPNNLRMVPIPSTPSGSRTLANKRSEFRRSGLEI